ncbi:GreA/GreB family elongation factor [Alkalihalobacterium alkalinitrilicum]|uniref:GreA/GreB family elongation factor n=1 Tax=Alkalihalobacterium alkalinitrilicum TaxID=427920 RepID=UPI0009958DA8|nr:GreA/GreB family elongation factor [Alkalihalobacterium alkalinitrilicum]
MILRKAIMHNWMKKRMVAQVNYLKMNRLKILQKLIFNKSEEIHVDPEQLIDNYIDRLSMYSLKVFDLVEFPSIPFVMIDSRVTIYEVKNKLSKTINICFPIQENEEIEYFSYLSPIGQQLLLRQVGDRFNLSECSQLKEVIIQNIEYSSI